MNTEGNTDVILRGVETLVAKATEPGLGSEVAQRVIKELSQDRIDAIVRDAVRGVQYIESLKASIKAVTDNPDVVTYNPDETVASAQFTNDQVATLRGIRTELKEYEEKIGNALVHGDYKKIENLRFVMQSESRIHRNMTQAPNMVANNTKVPAGGSEIFSKRVMNVIRANGALIQNVIS